MTDALSHFEDMIRDVAQLTGREFAQVPSDVARYADERAQHLSAIRHEPGFDRAVIAEANSVAMYAGLRIDDAADRADDQIWGMIFGGLRIAAMML